MTSQRAPLYPCNKKSSDDTALTPLYKNNAEFKAAQSELLAFLAKTYPTHFGDHCKPWAIGIREALLEELKGSRFPEELICHTLHYFTRSVPYLTSCVLSGYGSLRYSLNGEPVGTLSRRELIYALTQLVGLVKRKDQDQSDAYREWALREMVLGLLHGDVTTEGLVQSRVRQKVISKAVQLSHEDAACDTLKLRHPRTGELHPSVYAAPYLNDNLYKSFKAYHPDHVTSRKSRAKRALLFPQKKPPHTQVVKKTSPRRVPRPAARRQNTNSVRTANGTPVVVTRKRRTYRPLAAG